MTLTEDWEQLTPEEKYEKRFESFLNPDIEFASKEAEEKYKKRTKRYKDVIELKKPDRVPVVPNMGFYPADYAGITAEEAMHDYDKMSEAWKKFNADFDFDYLQTCMAIGSGNLFDILGFKLYRWPGHGTKPNTSYQCVEKEYMKEDEYDELIHDPTGYFLNKYLPRIFGSLEAWGKLPIFPSFVELPFVGGNMAAIGSPDVQESFKKFMEGGQEAVKWIQAAGATDGASTAVHGLPATFGGFTKAPFDVLGDTLRGTKNIMLDIYRRPEKIHEAMEVFVPFLVKLGVANCNAANNPFLYVPIHKGADTFMSREQFSEFYWPTFKKVLLGLIEEGCIPSVFVEGSYNHRLDLITDPDLPKGKTYWFFDKTDMAEVRRHLSGFAAFGGNLSASLLKTGPSEDVERAVRDLFDKAAGDGGYIFTQGAVIDNAEEEYIRTMVKAAKKYGKY